MPNESDHLQREGDKELKDVSEETAGQQVRPSTPSPHRENTLQASPPRLVSVEELMETAKGVTNMALAHEIMVNKDFQVKPTELPEGSLEHRVKEIMRKVFWDRLEAQLNEDPPSYEHAIKLLGEIKETLLSFLLPGHGRLCSRIEEVLDLPLIQQQAENGALNIGQLSQFVVEMMGSLCAPCRDEDVKKLRQITEIVPLLKAIFSVLDLMKVDMANFALKSIKPHLMQLSVEYERNKFQEFLEKQPNALDYTKKWLEETVKSLRETESCASASSDPPLHPLNVHNHAYIRLLRWDHASDPFPETVLMDQVRFLEMQQEAKWLVLLSSVLLIVYTTTGEAISGLPGLMETLKNTVSAMLTEMHMPSFSMQEALATIGEKLCVELSHCLSQHGFSSFSAESKSALKGQISAIIQPDNTVRKLMDSRIQSYLMAALESSQHKTPPPLPGGLAPVSRELKELSIRFSRLVNYNKLVFSPFYQKILQNILTPGESSGTET
ncbi:T-complex protein 11-like protein 1 [Poecilia latipinna]|uniref:T-complex 11, testis-specific-like 1 n=1 Tax=Poecilia latipinna TaxID=48699 RepID=A0A3B3U6E9_9TELE|nr:PREDICTED: T-complex protein 11-like protein 1 [Poecilia latipinna]XP_014911341.1 PREDICTED: T-complex protein 11-like protein 1 [Poecilia latipinna]XP_014911342.1 PREDICTED: T-complex protein 11-like protein 1 [Poecilia latipinna]